MEEQIYNEKVVAEGYAFLNEEDAKRALSESRRILQLEEKLDYAKPESILLVYRKAIQERVFKTPIGIQYLRRMQLYLLDRPEIDKSKVLPVPIYTSFEGGFRDNVSPVRNRVQPLETPKKKPALLAFSVILNVALVCAVLAMFFIALNSKHPNLVNYENTLVNKYAKWEQELTEREQTIREKERELLLQEHE